MKVQFVERQSTSPALLDRAATLETLSAFRRDWEAVAEGDSLLDVCASVGLVLFDLTTRLGLSPQEQAHVLGDPLLFDAQRKVNGNSI